MLLSVVSVLANFATNLMNWAKFKKELEIPRRKAFLSFISAKKYVRFEIQIGSGSVRSFFPSKFKIIFRAAKLEGVPNSEFMIDYLELKDKRETDDENSWLAFIQEAHQGHFSN